MIDSPVLPDELDALPGVLEQAGFPVSGLLVTHADWDHLLARIPFGDASLGCGETTAARLMAEPGSAQRRLRAFDDEYYLARVRPLALAGVQGLPVPGRLSIGTAVGASMEREIELHPTGGHTADGTAFYVPWADVLACGDYLSPVEIPMISEGGSVDGYLETLDRLRPLVQRAATVVPGHGAPLNREGALRVLDEDLEYLKALSARGAEAALPPARRSSEQKRIHRENVARCG